MAISPASDLILDVARAADPQKAAATTRALAAASLGADAGAGFAEAFNGAARTAAPAPSYSYQNPVVSTHVAKESRAQKAAIGFESVLLKTFVDEMLPKDAADFFGSGVAGDVWKSMLSQKIADEIAKSGALKLTDRLFATHRDLLRSPPRKGAVAPAPATPTRIKT